MPGGKEQRQIIAHRAAVNLLSSLPLKIGYIQRFIIKVYINTLFVYFSKNKLK